MKKFLSIISFSFLLFGSLTSCGDSDVGNDTSKYPTPKGALQEAFYKLKDNNFTLSYEDSYAAIGIKRNQETKYTTYSLESTGDLGFNGYAQNDDCVFSYNIVDNEVVSGVPVIDYNKGIMIKDIYDYRDGLEDFDYTILPSTYKSGEEYNYVFGENTKNDELIISVFLRMNYNPSALPRELTMKVVAGNLQISAITNYYELQDAYDSCNVVAYDVGETENTIIKKYLDDGLTSKTPLDQKFFHLIAPYLESYNYKTTIDARSLKTEDGMGYERFLQDQYFTENAIIYDTLSDNSNVVTGDIQTGLGLVCNFSMNSIDADKIDITYTPPTQDGDFYTYLYGEYLTYSMASLNFSNFVGYVDDTKENSYYITDSQTISILSYICQYEINDTDRAVRSLRLEVDDWNKNEFTLYFDIYNRSTNLDKGELKVKFSDVNNVSMPAVERYLNIGGKASEQNLDTLKSVLNKFKSNNYSMDIYGGFGLAKAYFTENYYYFETYGSKANNYGFIKLDGSIYEFSLVYNNDNEITDISIDKSKDLVDEGMQLPGCGAFYGSDDDAFYFSCFDESIYDYDEYEKDNIFGYSYWRNKTSGLSQKILNYFSPNNTVNLPQGSGFMVSDGGDDSYDTRVTLVLSYSNENATQFGAYMATYYDIDGTSFDYLDNFILENNK